MGDILWDETRGKAPDVTASVWRLWQKWGQRRAGQIIDAWGADLAGEGRCPTWPSREMTRQISPMGRCGDAHVRRVSGSRGPGRTPRKWTQRGRGSDPPASTKAVTVHRKGVREAPRGPSEVG